MQTVFILYIIVQIVDVCKPYFATIYENCFFEMQYIKCLYLYREVYCLRLTWFFAYDRINVIYYAFLELR